jgi:iron complex outermembrane receptor protein
MKIQRTPIASAVALVLVGAGLPVLAQQAAPAPAPAASAPAATQPQQLETVIVTGIRGSLQQSLNQKRNAESLVEVITAEDIGKMPDKNVADSLQRVPGVNVATAGGTEGGFGENDRVSLRGAPSFLTLTTLNGHTISSGDWYAENISGGGRSVSYSLFPSELIGRVTINKTSQAKLIEGGAVGAVDIETRKPLDFKPGISAFAKAEAAYTETSESTDPQLSAMVNWKNEQNTLGILVQAFAEKRKLRRMGQEFLWWDKVATWFAPDWIAANPEVEGKNISLLTGSTLFDQTRDRRGGLVDVQFKLTNDLTFDLTGFYSKLKADNINANFMLAPYQITSNNWSNVGGAVPSAFTITGDTITSFTFPSTCPVADCSMMGASVQDVISRPGSYSDSKFVNLDVNYRANDKLAFTGNDARHGPCAGLWLRGVECLCRQQPDAVRPRRAGHGHDRQRIHLLTENRGALLRRLGVTDHREGQGGLCADRRHPENVDRDHSDSQLRLPHGHPPAHARIAARNAGCRCGLPR